MNLLEAIPLMERIALLKDRDDKMTDFEMNFMEGLTRIASSGKMEDLSAPQSKTLMGIYCKQFILPLVQTAGYDRNKNFAKKQEEAIKAEEAK
jgi:hypothetical protein